MIAAAGSSFDRFKTIQRLLTADVKNGLQEALLAAAGDDGRIESREAYQSFNLLLTHLDAADITEELAVIVAGNGSCPVS